MRTSFRPCLPLLALAAAGTVALTACSSDPPASPASSAGADSSASDSGGAHSDASSDSTGGPGGDATAADASQGDATGGGGDGSRGDARAGDTGPVSGLPYGVGMIKVEVDGPGGRKLPTAIWYPTAVGAKGKEVSYGFGLLPSPLGAQEGAAPAKGPFPTVAFSHGNQGIPEQSVFLTEGLAARGFVVVAPEHVGNSFPTYDEKLFPAVSLWRPKDLTAAVDRLAKPVAADPPWLKGLADTDKLAVTGHSFGGYTALAFAGIVLSPPSTAIPNCTGVAKGDPVCDTVAAAGPPPWNLGDPRVDVSIPLAHALTVGFDPKSLAGHKVPIVLAAAKGDTITPYKTEAIGAYEAMQPPKALLTLDGGGHFSFAQACELAAVAPAALKAELQALCKPDAQPSLADSHAATLAITVAACEIYLKGNDAARAAFKPGPVAGLAKIAIASEGIAP